mmetsp:Transcript_45661/g.69821  ORF Transcript_45661/g.69821 Transcript_45661/m.69821 type:complete len:113 (-) Transcript_45661:266-604(-)
MVTQSQLQPWFLQECSVTDVSLRERRQPGHSVAVSTSKLPGCVGVRQNKQICKATSFGRSDKTNDNDDDDETVLEEEDDIRDNSANSGIIRSSCASSSCIRNFNIEIDWGFG